MFAVKETVRTKMKVRSAVKLFQTYVSISYVEHILRIVGNLTDVCPQWEPETEERRFVTT